MNHKLHITALALALSAAYPALAADEEPITKVEVKGRNSSDDSYAAGSAHTSTRMEMSIRDTPQSVSVISRALMGGTGDPSAAVNMVRKRPGRILQGSASVILRRWDDQRAEVDLSSPLSPDGKVRGRVALAHEDRDSYIDLYHERKTVGMAIVEADLTPGTLLTAGIDFQRNTPTGATWGAVPYWNADGTLANMPRNFTLTTPWSTWANKQQTAFASLDQRFGAGWKLHLGYARTDSRNNTTVAYGGAGHPNTVTGGGMSLWSGVWGEGKAINDNYDLYATGPFTLLGRQHTLIAGWNGASRSVAARAVRPTSCIRPQFPTTVAGPATSPSRPSRRMVRTPRPKPNWAAPTSPAASA